MTGYIPLSSLDLLLATLLIVLNGAISFAYGLRIEKSLAMAALRMILQLAAVAVILRFIFAQASPLWSIAFAALMAAASLLEIIMRQQARFKSIPAQLLSASPAFLSGLATTLIALAIIQPDPWYAPRFLLPILGMLVGNALTGVGLVLDTLTSAALRERAVIESRLALGETRYKAFEDIVRRTLKTAMMPLLNAMAAAGIVSLPGMMTGQILAGIDPIEAAKYQILIMFLIAGSTALAVLAAALAAVHYVTDARHRLRLDALHPTKTD